MNENTQQPENERSGLDAGEKMSSDTYNPCKNACEEIMDKIRGSGIPVSVNPSLYNRDTCNVHFIEITRVSQFIRDSRIDFNCYKKVMDSILNMTLKPGSRDRTGLKRADLKGLCHTDEEKHAAFLNDDRAAERSSSFGAAIYSNTKAYNILKYATEKYVDIFLGLDPSDISCLPGDILPYIDLITAKLSSIHCKYEIEFRPMFAELIWNYWHEEGMVSQTMKAISTRFQNKRARSGFDPLANLTLDPLRPLNNLVWGYIQDEPNRLTAVRVAGEMLHLYGIAPVITKGRLNPADSRSFFIQAFHNLLYKCSVFYKEADNIMKVPDAFPVLNALREVHLLLSEGADNQFGDLPFTARIEMLIEQYLLARPEVREFLGGRVMVPYDEAWMDRVDSMKTLQGWPGANTSYFHDLAVFGEEIILSIRWISWSQINNRDFAREWAIIFRDAIQRYIHCYQAVTGVDIAGAEIAGAIDEKSVMPSLLIQRKSKQDMLMRRR
jgi:hypothetical protein